MNTERPEETLELERICAVLFDFGGVLAEEGFRNGLAALAREQGSDPAALVDAGMDAVYDSGFVLGRGSAADFWALLRARTGLRGDDETLTRRILDGFRPRPRMLALARRLRGRGYLTAILSDQTHWLDELEQRYGFGDAFDRIFNSYDLGKGKRDPSLFLDVAGDLRLAPERLLFIDDSPGNCARARSVGYQALRFEDPARCETTLDALPLRPSPCPTAKNPPAGGPGRRSTPQRR